MGQNCHNPLPPRFSTWFHPADRTERTELQLWLERPHLCLLGRVAAASTSLCHDPSPPHCFKAEQEVVCRATPTEPFVRTETSCGLKGTELNRPANWTHICFPPVRLRREEAREGEWEIPGAIFGASYLTSGFPFESAMVIPALTDMVSLNSQSSFLSAARVNTQLNVPSHLASQVALVVKKRSRSVVSDSSRPHGLQPTRLLHPRDFPGKSTGVGCHCLLRRTCLQMQEI